MDYLYFVPEIIILLMLAIAFLQSGIDKITDWKSNLNWLNGHFAQSPLKGQVSIMLGIITVMEIISGGSALIGSVLLFFSHDITIALFSAILSALTFIFLFFGQRLAKDYPGAQTIVVYLIPTVFLLYLLLNK